jgi:tetratricopeptide (TPR) repeat protein
MRSSRTKAGLSVLAIAVAVAITAFAPGSGARADNALDCYAENLDLRIRGCTALLDQGNLSPLERATVLASRALALSMKTWYPQAIQDYDRSLDLAPNQPIALNNRAWAYFRWGKPAAGVDDVEKSLRLDPTSGAAYDTRAHIRQSLGDPQQAMADYRLAMTFGGERMVKMYQCGLTQQGLYKGPMDGIATGELENALSICTQDAACDPLPADEECRTGTS